MTFLALVPQLPLVIVIPVTSRTGQGNTRQLAIEVALLTSDVHVSTPQQEASDRMIDLRILPIKCVVAGSTVASQPILMDIVLLVTRCADHGYPSDLPSEVTILADQVNVPASQRKASEAVIELGVDQVVPRRGPMAGFTILAQATFMYVVFLVAGDAGDGDVGPLMVDMTVLAC